MNDKTTELLEKLAGKLGTTSEYLWGVLIKQAPISATVKLGELIFTIIMGFVLWKIHKWLCEKRGPYNSIESRYEEYGELAYFPMGLAFVGWGIVMIITFFMINNIIAGFFNPEYWALNFILVSLEQ